MRTYDRAEEKNIQRWHEARGHIQHSWLDYDIYEKSDYLRPFWEPDEPYYYGDDFDIDNFHYAKLLSLLEKLRVRGTGEILNNLYW